MTRSLHSHSVDFAQVLWHLAAVYLLLVQPHASASAAEPEKKPQPVKIILDTDIGSDCDDVGAVALLNALADRGEAEILGIMVCNSGPWGPGCVDAINTWYGRGDVPIGAWKETDLPEPSKYQRHVAENFPHDLKDLSDVPDAVQLYRKLLADQPDASVAIVTVGTLNNLHLLHQRDPELVRRKVKLLSCMGGGYPEGFEANFVKPPAVAASTKYVVENWPTPILFSGVEIGFKIKTGARLARETPPENPVRAGYAAYFGAEGKSRESWDQTAVLAAARGPDEYWNVVRQGRNVVDETGGNRWQETPDDPRHSYLVPKMRPQDVARVIEDLMVQAPARRTGGAK